MKQPITDTELNAFVAGWCEKKPTEAPNCIRAMDTEFWVWRDEGDDFNPRWCPRYDFATDRNACAKFEALVVERGKWIRYHCSLIDAICKAHPDLVEYNLLPEWIVRRLIRATPQQRCKALVAMAGGGDE